jgi:hypothetical protein
MAAAATNSYSSTTAVEFQYKATSAVVCTPAYTTPSTTNLAATSTHYLSTKKLAAVVPDLSTGSTGNWLFCTYSKATLTTGLLTSSALYSVATAPTIVLTAVDNTGVVPATGSALGGNTITINGDFFSGATAKIGTLPLTGVVVATDFKSLTGVVPAQPASTTPRDVSVTTTGGTVTWDGAGYVYTNGISVSPNTAPTNVAATDLDVQGVGFDNLVWGTTAGTLLATGGTGAHVYLVAGAYVSATVALPAARTAVVKGECLNVLPISDTELICTLDTANADGLAGGVIANGTYTLTTVESGAVEAATPNPSIISSGSTFTVAPY